MTEFEARLVRTRALLPAVLFWASIVAFWYGFIDNAMWRAVSLGSSQLVWLALIAVVLAAIVAKLARRAMASVLLGLGAIALVVLAGPLACAAVALLVLAALGVGSALMRDTGGAASAVAVLVGLAILCGIDGWLLPFRLHFRAVYLPVLLLIVALRWRAIVMRLRPLPRCWSAAVDASRWPAALAMLAVVVASAWAWLPTTTYDDLAYHLALPSQLAELGYYQMNAGTNVWALAPWIGDVAQGIARVIAGVAARGAVDVAWFAVACVLVWQLGRELGLSHVRRWLAVALFAALPMTMFLLHSMQSEGPTVAVMLGLAWLIVRHRVPDARQLFAIAALFGMLLGLKVSNLWFAGPLGLAWLWRARGVRPWRWALPAVILGFIVAGSSYAYAWVLAGNPVLPLFNNVFHSAFYPAAAFHDARWYTGFDAGIIWNLVFHPGRYIEGGSIGPIFLIALAGSFFVALARPRARALALVGIVALLLPLWRIQYLRYAYPALALLLPAMLLGLPANASRVHARCVHAAVWVLAAVSLVFAGSSAWQVRSGAIGIRLTQGDAGVLARYAPVRVALAHVDQHVGRSACVLMLAPDAPFAAEMAGRAFVTNWYDPTLSALAANARRQSGPQGWLKLFVRSGANVVITDKGHLGATLMQAIHARDGRRVFAISELAVWRLAPTRSGPQHDLAAERDLARRLWPWSHAGDAMARVNP